MNIKKMSKLLMGGALALSLTFSSVVPAMEVQAASSIVERRYIKGDGVRLRKDGHEGGKILELMYNGEAINYYPYEFGTDTEYNYMCRLKTGTYGYVRHEYTR